MPGTVTITLPADVYAQLMDNLDPNAPMRSATAWAAEDSDRRDYAHSYATGVAEAMLGAARDTIKIYGKVS